MITINDIDFSLLYEGYLWLSNGNKPKLSYPAAKIDAQLFKKLNPFVAEGYLYNKETRKSISIKYIDGKYHIYETEVNSTDISNEDVDKIEYLTWRMPNSSTLWAKFLRYWHEVEDAKCLDMKVLEIEKEVFLGFKKEEE